MCQFPAAGPPQTPDWEESGPTVLKPLVGSQSYFQRPCTLDALGTTATSMAAGPEVQPSATMLRKQAAAQAGY